MDSGVGAAYVMGFFVGMLVGGVIGLCVSALFLKLAVRWIEGFALSFGRALLVVFLAGLCSFVLSSIVGFVLGLIAGVLGLAGDVGSGAMIAVQLFSGGIGLLLGFAITTAFVNWMVRRPDGSAMGYGRAALVAAVYYVIVLVLVVIFVAIAILLLGAAVPNLITR